jgi:hypothetical protein
MPILVAHYLAQAAIHSRMVFRSGRVYIKHCGNPSGFPNTIRLNCVLQKVVNLICMHRSAEKNHLNIHMRHLHHHIASFYCGDDGMNLALTPEGDTILHGEINSLDEWRNTPWDVKLEGKVYKTDSSTLADLPSFISRSPVYMGGTWYYELNNPAKLVTKLVAYPGDIDTVEGHEKHIATLEGLEISMIHTLVLHYFGRRFDPYADFVWRCRDRLGGRVTVRERAIGLLSLLHVTEL